MNTFIEYPKCTTCQKAKKCLIENQVVFTSRHIKDERLTVEELRTLWQQSGLPLKSFFNTSGMKYRELDLKHKLPQMDETSQLELLASDGMLVKRPILVVGNQVLVGYKAEPYKRLLKK